VLKERKLGSNECLSLACCSKTPAYLHTAPSRSVLGRRIWYSLIWRKGNSTPGGLEVMDGVINRYYSIGLNIS
jgi:hypothetical protein